MNSNSVELANGYYYELLLRKPWIKRFPIADSFSSDKDLIILINPNVCYILKQFIY